MESNFSNMKTFSAVFLFIIIIGFSMCKKETSLDYSSDLVGKWSWIVTCPGTNKSDCVGPDSIHPSFEIAFTTKSIFNVSHNDSISVSSKYSTYKSVYNDKDTAYFVKFDTGVSYLYSIIHDTLTLENTEGIIVYKSRYRRIE